MRRPTRAGSRSRHAGSVRSQAKAGYKISPEKCFSASLRLSGLLLAASITITAQIPAPKDTLGFTPGDDRKLASWNQIVTYFEKLDQASDRVKVEVSPYDLTRGRIVHAAMIRRWIEGQTFAPRAGHTHIRCAA